MQLLVELHAHLSRIEWAWVWGCDRGFSICDVGFRLWDLNIFVIITYWIWHNNKYVADRGFSICDVGFGIGIDYVQMAACAPAGPLGFLCAINYLR